MLTDIVHVPDQAKILFIPRPRTNYGKFSVRFAVADNWNKIPLHTKNVSFLESFRNEFKYYLLTSEIRE